MCSRLELLVYLRYDSYERIKVQHFLRFYAESYRHLHIAIYEVHTLHSHRLCVFELPVHYVN